MSCCLDWRKGKYHAEQKNRPHNFRVCKKRLRNSWERQDVSQLSDYEKHIWQYGCFSKWIKCPCSMLSFWVGKSRVRVSKGATIGLNDKATKNGKKKKSIEKARPESFFFCLGLNAFWLHKFTSHLRLSSCSYVSYDVKQLKRVIAWMKGRRGRPCPTTYSVPDLCF